MPFGQSITSILTSLSLDDPLMPQVISDGVRALPPNPIKGPAVSLLVDELFPSDPMHPVDVGQTLSAIIFDSGPGLGDGGFLLD